MSTSGEAWSPEPDANICPLCAHPLWPKVLRHWAELLELIVARSGTCLGGCETQHLIGNNGHRLKTEHIKNKESMQNSLFPDSLTDFTMTYDLDLTVFVRVGSELYVVNLNSGISIYTMEISTPSK